jgi:hypothetical protein
MKTIINDLKTTLIFSLLSTVLTSFTTIVSSIYLMTSGNDKTGWFYFMFLLTIGTKFLFAFLTCFISILITKKITKENFIISILKIVIFCFIYAIIKYLYSIFISQNTNNQGSLYQYFLIDINAGIVDALFYALFILQFSKFKIIKSDKH